MIEKQDYTKYLSYDNGKGLLLSSSDILILEQYSIVYDDCSNIMELIFRIGEVIDQALFEEDMEDLEAVLSHLKEIHYYWETKK